MDFANLKLILVPTDFSEVSEAALHVAVQLARSFGAAISHLLVESVAEKVVQNAPCPVLVVPGSPEEDVKRTS